MADGYVKFHVENTKKYIELEIEILNSVRNYTAASQFISQLSDRILLVVEEQMPREVCEKLMMTEDRRIYRDNIAKELEEMAKRYFPFEGPFWESLSETLIDISQQLRK